MATAQMLDMNHLLHPKYMCFDSAHDTLPFYNFLLYKSIIPVIDLNKRRKSQYSHLNDDNSKDYTINENGCDYTRMRNKFVCPIKRHNRNSDKVESCPQCSCTNSEYGHVVYTYMKSPRYALPRDSQKFKDLYKNRTCTERINNRNLNNYHLQDMRVKDYAKVAFFMLIAAVNIHLDAWLKQDEMHDCK